MSILEAHWSDEVTEDGQLLVRFLEYHGSVSDIWLGDMEDTTPEDHEIARAIARLPQLLAKIKVLLDCPMAPMPTQTFTAIQSLRDEYNRVFQPN